MSYLKILLIILLFILLTLLTQIGGILLLFTIWLNTKTKSHVKYQILFLFLAVYFFSTFLVVPLIAPFFGREKVTDASEIKPANFMTVLFNRNYVNPELNQVLTGTAESLRSQGITITYLDANFPFINKFPLLPHLSHNDGKKIDLALIYENHEGVISDKQKSRSGYGVFEGPEANELDQTNQCKRAGYFQYDYPQYFTFGTINSGLKFSKDGTKVLVDQLLKDDDIEKVFIEPHLKSRLGLSDSRIRFQGCRSVRHDDHIHLQVR